MPIPDLEPENIPTETDHARGRILLADDDLMFRDGLSKLLRRHGYDCEVAPDAAAAALILREQPIETLIADIHMPGNARLELIHEVPSIKRGLPIILMTGRPAFETAAQSVRLSISAYLTKPPDLKELLPLLGENIARYRRLQTVSASRARIDTWSRELAVLEENLRRPAAEKKQTSDYLRVTLRNMAIQLAELSCSAGVADRMGGAAEEAEKIELINALQQTIAILENTRKSFKSKELGDLRKRLSSLLAEKTESPVESNPPAG
jgi:DNA-binding response OmpR family regulator